MERSTNKNYCSVNLLSEVSKINEKLLTDRLVDHLDKCDLFFISIMAIGLLHQLQIFRQLYLVDLLWLLTGLGLLKLQHLIYPLLTRVWHAGLLHKLMFYVILGQIFGLISPYFSVIDNFKWFWIGSLQKNIRLKLEFLKAPLLVQTLSLLYTKDLPDDVICNNTIYNDDTTLYSKCDQASDLWQQLQLASEL